MIVGFSIPWYPQRSRSRDYEAISQENEGTLEMGEEAEVRQKPSGGKKKADDLKEEIQMVCTVYRHLDPF